MANPAIVAYSAGILKRNLSIFRKEYPRVVRSRDIEHVHRMRVAARRLATALEVFNGCYPAKRVKVWQKDVRAVTRALGKARDLDIQIVHLRDFLRQVSEPGLRPGIQRLLLRTRQERQRAQVRLLASLGEIDEHQSIIAMDVQARLAAEKKEGPSGSDESIVRRYALDAIAPAIDGFIQFDPFVDRIEAVKELHAMRLAAKRLRYTLECFSDSFPNGFEGVLETLRKIQEQLGVIHDCDVWEMNREKFLYRERRKAIRYSGSDRIMKRLLPGLDYFFGKRREQRENYYAEFVRNWDALGRTRYWTGLKKEIMGIVRSERQVSRTGQKQELGGKA